MTPRPYLLKIHDRISRKDMGAYKVITGSANVDKVKLHRTCFYEMREAYIFSSMGEKTRRPDKKRRGEALEKELKSILLELSDEAIKNELIAGWRGDNQWPGSWDYANDENQ